MPTEPKGRRQSEKPHKQRTWYHEKQRFGTLPYDKLVAPTVGIFDEPTRCYKINHEWASIIMGLVSLLTETRMWEDATNEGFPAIREVQKFLLGETCDVLDCAEIEDCLETSALVDTLAIYQYSVMEANTQAHFDDLTTAYDGTAQSIGSSIPTTAPELDPDQSDALCFILGRIVDVYAGGKGVQFVLMTGIQAFYQQMLGAVRDVFPIIPNHLFHLLGDELFGCVADVAAALVVLADHAAIIELACCLNSELQSVAMTEAAWNAALTSCEAELSSNAARLACLMLGDNSQEHYLAFLEAYNQILVRQVAGDTFDCQCDETWCYFYDFETTTYDWTLIEYDTWPYTEGDIGIGGNTGVPVNISIDTGGAFVNRLSYRVFGVGAGGVNVQAYADGVLIYDENVGNGARGIPVFQNVTTLRWHGIRTFGWGISEAKVAGQGADPLLAGDACP